MIACLNKTLKKTIKRQWGDKRKHIALNIYPLIYSRNNSNGQFHEQLVNHLLVDFPIGYIGLPQGTRFHSFQINSMCIKLYLGRGESGELRCPRLKMSWTYNDFNFTHTMFASGWTSQDVRLEMYTVYPCSRPMSCLHIIDMICIGPDVPEA